MNLSSEELQIILQALQDRLARSRYSRVYGKENLILKEDYELDLQALIVKLSKECPS